MKTKTSFLGFQNLYFRFLILVSNQHHDTSHQVTKPIKSQLKTLYVEKNNELHETRTPK